MHEIRDRFQHTDSQTALLCYNNNNEKICITYYMLCFRMASGDVFKFSHKEKYNNLTLLTANNPHHTNLPTGSNKVLLILNCGKAPESSRWRLDVCSRRCQVVPSYNVCVGRLGFRPKGPPAKRGSCGSRFDEGNCDLQLAEEHSSWQTVEQNLKGSNAQTDVLSWEG